MFAKLRMKIGRSLVRFFGRCAHLADRFSGTRLPGALDGVGLYYTTSGDEFDLIERGPRSIHRIGSPR